MYYFGKRIKVIFREGGMLGNKNEHIRGKKQSGVCAVAINSLLLMKYKAQDRRK